MDGCAPGIPLPLQSAPCGLSLRPVVLFTDIVIPGLNSTTDVQARINAGESVHIIRGTKGEGGAAGAVLGQA